MGGNPPPAPPAASLVLTPAFKLVFFVVVALTLISLGVDIYLVTGLNPKDAPSEPMKQLIETCSTTYKLGFGAIVGLIGGKAL